MIEAAATAFSQGGGSAANRKHRTMANRCLCMAILVFITSFAHFAHTCLCPYDSGVDLRDPGPRIRGPYNHHEESSPDPDCAACRLLRTLSSVRASSVYTESASISQKELSGPVGNYHYQPEWLASPLSVRAPPCPAASRGQRPFSKPSRHSCAWRRALRTHYPFFQMRQGLCYSSSTLCSLGFLDSRCGLCSLS